MEIPFTVDFQENIFLVPGISLLSGTAIQVRGGILPMPLCEGVTYYVIHEPLGPYKLSTTPDGCEIDMIGPGSGTFFSLAPK